MEPKERYTENFDDVFDDLGVEAQERDIHYNKTIIGKELLEADKKRWSIFRYTISLVLLLVTTIGYTYYNTLHSDIETANRKVVQIEEKYAKLPPREYVLQVEKRFSGLENKLDDLATTKQLLELKSELMNMIINLHAKPSGVK